MSVVHFGPDQLLAYSPIHQVLICKDCQSAIQKSALESHLLRHKIYRGDRQRLLSELARLDLPEPDDVPLPPAGSDPVDGLPILHGYRCGQQDCGHLTVSEKRMKRHLSEAHAVNTSNASMTLDAVPVKLQTFFRGTKIRYFEVYPHEELPSQSPNSQVNSSHAFIDHDIPGSAEADVCFSADATSLDLETLKTFYHFISDTSLTLPGSGEAQAHWPYWQKQVVEEALQRHWLMSGLLALAMHHMAALADDSSRKEDLVSRASEFSVTFNRVVDQLVGIPSRFAMISTQVRALLSCVQCSSDLLQRHSNSTPTLSLPSVISILRQCDTVLDISANRTSVETNVPQQEQELAPGFLQLGLSSSVGIDSDAGTSRVPSTLVQRLRSLPFRIAVELGKPEDPQDVFATLSACRTLILCCSISFEHDNIATGWRGVAVWLNKLPDHFVDMISSHKPGALIMLAHWAAFLLKRAEDMGCWYLRGLANHVVVDVGHRLSEQGDVFSGLIKDLRRACCNDP